MVRTSIVSISLITLVSTAAGQPTCKLTRSLTISGARPFSHAAPTITYSPDGKKIAVPWTKGVYIFKSRNGKPETFCKGGPRATQLFYQPDGKSIFGPLLNQPRIVGWKSSDGVPSGVTRIGWQPHWHLAMNAAGVIAIAANDGLVTHIKVWDSKSQKLKCEKKFQDENFDSISIDSTGKRIAACTTDHVVLARVNGNEITVEKTLRTRGTPIKSAFSPDGKFLATIYYHDIVKIWDLEAGKLLTEFSDKQFRSDDRSYNAMAFSPDGKTIALGGGARVDNKDPFLALVDAKSGKLLASMSSQLKGVVHHLDFSPDGKQLATTSAGEVVVHLWDVSKFSGAPQKSDKKSKPSPQDSAKKSSTASSNKKPKSSRPKEVERVWTSANGEFTLKARLLDQKGEKVRLRKPNGKVITVNKPDLSKADQQYLETRKKR